MRGSMPPPSSQLLPSCDQFSLSPRPLSALPIKYPNLPSCVLQSWFSSMSLDRLGEWLQQLPISWILAEIACFFITQPFNNKNLPSRQVMRAFSWSTQPCSLYIRFNLPFTLTFAQISSPSTKIRLSQPIHYFFHKTHTWVWASHQYFMLLHPPTLLNNRGPLTLHSGWMQPPLSIPHCSAS